LVNIRVSGSFYFFFKGCLGIKIGLIGCGAIGSVIAKALEKEKGMELGFVLDLNKSKCEELIGKLKEKPKIVDSVEEMLECDLIVEAASQEAVKEYAERILEECNLMIMSVGALKEEGLLKKLREKAESKGKKIYLPSGAIAGLDAVKAAMEAGIEEVMLTSTKSPESLEGAPFFKEKKIDLKEIRKPTIVFEGNALEAAKFFPKNINVSVALSLAGIGVKNTKVRIVVDPSIKINRHEIKVKGEFGELYTRTENIPFPENPRTSFLAALSAVRTLRNLKESIVIGT